MDRKTEKRGLGRGLAALMAEQTDLTTNGAQQLRADQSLATDLIIPNPNQPRRTFEPNALQELAASLNQKGMIQPLMVRPASEPGKYEIVVGERRWRAAQIAQMHEVPVIIRDLDDMEMLEIAIIENVQRADLNAIEEALGYRQLMDRYGYTQEKIAEGLSRSRSHIANILRLLSLPDEVQSMIAAGKLSAGHARALITTPNPSELAVRVVGKGLSVRETEDLVRRTAVPKSAKKGPRLQEKDADTKALEADLSAGLGMLVSIHHEPGGERGRLTITYDTLDELDALCRALSAVQISLIH